MSKVNQYIHPSTAPPPYGAPQSNHAPQPQHHMSTGGMIASGVGAAAVAGVAYEVYEYEQRKHQHELQAANSGHGGYPQQQHQQYQVRKSLDFGLPSSTKVGFGCPHTGSSSRT